MTPSVKKIYIRVWGLGLRTLSDLGIHAVLTGGLALQTEESWTGFVGKVISYQGNDVEVYFEEDDFDQFLEKLDSIKTAQYVQPVMEHAWGQGLYGALPGFLLNRGRVHSVG